VSFDLAVIGGGPAGCAAAIQAANLGSKVVLFERSRFPRHKVCGEFVSAESLEILHKLLAPPYRSRFSNAPQISSIRILLDGTVLSAEILPAAVSIARFDLDSALWESASHAGVEVRDDCQVHRVEGEGPFGVHFSDRNLETRAVVNASGRWSNFTSIATKRRLKSERWIGVKAHFYEPESHHGVDLYFFDGGYCGVQPVGVTSNGAGTRINACAMVKAETATTLEAVFACHPALLQRSRFWTRITEQVSTAPLVFHPAEPVQGSMFQVGDAATFVDPFIGDGISLALRSGVLAAECRAASFNAGASLQQALSDYSDAYEKQLAPVFRASSRLRQLLRAPAMVRKSVLSLLRHTPVITRQMVRLTR